MKKGFQGQSFLRVPDGKIGSGPWGQSMSQRPNANHDSSFHLQFCLGKLVPSQASPLTKGLTMWCDTGHSAVATVTD